MKTTKKRGKKQTGPGPDRLKLEGDWKDQLKKALEKKRPPGGWPGAGNDKKNPKG